MKIIYITNSRIPTEKAHGVQIMKMCEAFSDLRHDILLLIPRRFNKIKANPLEFYNVKNNFKIKKILTLDLLPLEKFLGRFAFYVQNASFAVLSLIFVGLNKTDCIFTRDLLSAMLLSAFGKRVCFEMHDSVPKNFLTKRFFKKISKIVSTNNYKKEEIIQNFAIDNKRILVAPNGVDLKMFDIKESKEECREMMKFRPEDKNIVLYVGRPFHKWKGTDILKQSHNLLGPSCLVELITDKPYNQIPFWMKSADVLVLPNSKKVDEMQSKATSPLKLFEYMASGTPIVASDIPAIREIVNDAEVFFVEPDSPEKLAEKIKEVLSNPKEAERRAGLAKEKVKEFAWIKRAEKIAGFLERKIESVCYFGCYDSNYARNRVLIGGLKKNGCAVVECQSAHKDRKKYFDLWKKFSKNCKNCDVIIVAHPGHGLVWFAKIISRKPIIFDPIYSYYDSYIFDRKLCGEKTLKAKYYHFWDWFCSRIADCVLLECGTLIDYFINEFGLPREKFIKVIMSADDETLKPREKEPSGKFITHFHGTFIPFHGIEYIVKAAKLLENEKDMVFNIIGSGQISKKIDALIKELDVKNINYWGKRIPASEITEQIVKADICLGFFTTGPRAQKVMTNKIFESIAMKKPVITADLPVMREIYRDGENIIFCKGESAEDLAGKILMLKNDENLRAKIALNAYNLFKEKLNPKAVVGQMMDVLEKKI